MNTKKRLEEYAEVTVWMSAFNWRAVKIKELPFQKEGLVTAFYSVLNNTIYIAPDKSEAVFFGILVHEMYHAYQRYSMGLAKYLFQKTFCRRKLEDGAEYQEENAIEWYHLNKYLNK